MQRFFLLRYMQRCKQILVIAAVYDFNLLHMLVAQTIETCILAKTRDSPDVRQFAAKARNFIVSNCAHYNNMKYSNL